MSARDYQPVIGLEVHCQLKTASKMFSACPVGLLAEPNTLVDPYTLGLPGTLPVANAAAVMAGLELPRFLELYEMPPSLFLQR